MADVTLTYDGDTILELSASGTKTIKTGGKFCSEDIELTYVNPSGGLPSIISKLDGGSFTLASDTRADSYTIPTSLNIAPKGFVVWSDGEFYDTDKTSTSFFVMLATVSRLTFTNASGSLNGAYTIQYYRYSDKRASVNNGVRAGAQMENYLATDHIKLNDTGHYYESGRTYKWLAWA